MRPGSRRRTVEGPASGRSVRPPPAGPGAVGGSGVPPPPPSSSRGHRTLQSKPSPSRRFQTRTPAPTTWATSVRTIATISQVTGAAYRRGRVRGYRRSARRCELLLDLHERQHGLGGECAGVALVATRAGQRLVEVVD